MTHEELRELIPAHALDALSPEEAREVEAHLRTCDECRADLTAFQEVSSDLARGIPMVDPPAGLRERILDAIQSEAIQSEVRPRAKVVAFPRIWTLALAAAAAVAIVLAGIAVSLNQRLATLNERLAAQEQVLVLLASPSTKTATLAGSVQAKVRFVYDPVRRQGALIVSDLGDPGSEFVYQLWLVAGQQPESAGVFRPVPGRPIIVPVAADFGRYQAVAISVERGPSGSPRPTTTPILAASI